MNLWDIDMFYFTNDDCDIRVAPRETEVRAGQCEARNPTGQCEARNPQKTKIKKQASDAEVSVSS